MWKPFLKKDTVYPLSEKFVSKIYNNITSDLATNYLRTAKNSGSTAIVIIIYKKNNMSYLNILNTGDSRCVLSRDNIAVPLTKDHKPNSPDERKRIEKLGGEITKDKNDEWRIKDLSVSRAFGDIDAIPFVTCMPDIFNHKLQKTDKFIVIACDGLWDVMTNQEVVNFVNTFEISDKVNISRKLAEHAIEKGSTDNVSVIIVFF